MKFRAVLHEPSERPKVEYSMSRESIEAAATTLLKRSADPDAIVDIYETREVVVNTRRKVHGQTS